MKREGKVAGLFTVGIILAYDSPTSLEVLRGLQGRLEEYQKTSGERLEIIVKKAGGQVSLLPELVQALAASSDLLVPVSTAALQASLIASDNRPIVFSSVANPYIVRAGRTAVDHDPRVTGVCSTAPIRQVLELIHRALPAARRVGTVWTPSEINSEYYFQLMKESADEMGLEIIGQPIGGAGDIVQAVQALIRDRVEVLFPVSDNTINSNFPVLARLAAENRLPLFAAFATGAELGACASMGFGFDDIGRKTAELVIRIKNGESPARIPFQYIDRVKFYVNDEAARLQGIKLPESLTRMADRIISNTERVGTQPGSQARGVE
ncbi:MAG: ABC transporter substrate-binding protein [Candidatus Saccharicenans sp.]|nr:ABC transporter substrate-binding protein [Candidatus Saccharicenans sp.]